MKHTEITDAEMHQITLAQIRDVLNEMIRLAKPADLATAMLRSPPKDPIALLHQVLRCVSARDPSLTATVLLRVTQLLVDNGLPVQIPTSN